MASHIWVTKHPPMAGLFLSACIEKKRYLESARPKMESYVQSLTFDQFVLLRRNERLQSQKKFQEYGEYALTVGELEYIERVNLYHLWPSDDVFTDYITLLEDFLIYARTAYENAAWNWRHTKRTGNNCIDASEFDNGLKRWHWSLFKSACLCAYVGSTWRDHNQEVVRAYQKHRTEYILYSLRYLLLIKDLSDDAIFPF